MAVLLPLASATIAVADEPSFRLDAWSPLQDRNAQIEAIPLEQRAWPGLARAHILLERSGFPETSFYDHHDMTLEERASLEARLEQPKTIQILQLVHEAAARPHLGIITGAVCDPTYTSIWNEINPEASEQRRCDPITPDTLVLSSSIEHLQVSRRLSQVLHADSRIALERNNTDRVVDNVLARLRLARLVYGEPLLIEKLVGASLAQSAANDIAYALARDPSKFTEPNLNKLAAELERSSDLRFSLDGERTITQDVLVRATDDAGNYQPGWFAASTLLMLHQKPEELDFTTGNAKQALHWYDTWSQAYHDASQTPWEKSHQETTAQLELGYEQLDPVSAILFDILLPVPDNAVASISITNMHLRAVSIAIAAHRHRLVHGEWPHSLEVLDPALRPKILIDPYTGNELLFRIVDDQPLIYSASADGDDDRCRTVYNGEDRLPTLPFYKTQRPTPDGDWILYPPQP